MLKQTIYSVLFAVTFIFLFGIHSCIDDPGNDEVSGIFTIQISGDIQETMEGKATFSLISKDQYSLVIIKLEVDELNYVWLSFVNPSSTSIFLEPGDYNIVSQITVDSQKEVLIDYYIDGVKYIADSGSVSLGVSKETQLKGRINTASFPDINSFISGNYDAIRE
ncbi:hypothetical protein ACFLU5_09505 [Bacteroidota bacterium]